MTSYVLIPGADGRAWYWHRVVPELRARGHDVIAVDLPVADTSAGLTECADAIVQAIGERRQSILVAQSLAGFIAPLVCERVPVTLLVLLNAMVPSPHESAGDWWTTTGHAQARVGYGEFDVLKDFFHDVPPDVTAEALAAGASGPSERLFGQPWPLEAWPHVPTRFLQSRDDRFFPLEFQRRVVRQRLGIPLDEMPGGHLVALSRPTELVERLEMYRQAVERGEVAPGYVTSERHHFS